MQELKSTGTIITVQDQTGNVDGQFPLLHVDGSSSQDAEISGREKQIEAALFLQMGIVYFVCKVTLSFTA